MPPQPLRDRFADLIARVSDRLGSPRFEPHITLGVANGSQPKVVQQARALAQRLGPLPIHLTKAVIGDEYFRCIFVLVEPTPSVLLARELAWQLLRDQSDEGYIPHMSLAYGNLTPVQKEEILNDIGRDFATSFIVDRLALVIPEGRPEEWRHVEVFDLK